MDLKKKYFILTFYHFVSIEQPFQEVEKHQQFFENRDIRCRIYISHEGINGQMSGWEEDANVYMQWMKLNPHFQNIEFKIDPYHEHVFPKKTVKYREQLVALDVKPDLTQRGEYVTPKQWKEMLEKRDQKCLLLDVRNDYEWKIGHFEGAHLPSLDMFREFPKFAEQLKHQYDPKETKVMMYCTGGIRCELYSALLKQSGFQSVFQLKGGVINYGHEVGADHWLGKLFVFDDRLAVPISVDVPDQIISHCLHCNVISDIYYNCANMDCNELFLCCPTCAEKYHGCCCVECAKMPRLRPYEKSERPKPFRKWYNYTLSS